MPHFTQENVALVNVCHYPIIHLFLGGIGHGRNLFTGMQSVIRPSPM